MSRRSPGHKFVIQGIKDAPLQPRKAAEPKRGPDSNAPSGASVSTPHLPPVKSRNWLEKLFTKPTWVPDSRSSAADTSDSMVHSTAGAVHHDATEFNWASFFCPYCKASSFIQCSGGHLACDGTVQIRDGRRFHQCYCGSAGFIEGSIKTIEAEQHTFRVEPKMSNASGEKYEGSGAGAELPKTSRQLSRSTDADGPETPSLPPNPPPPRSRDRR
jgi:hypothetical protein